MREVSTSNKPVRTTRPIGMPKKVSPMMKEEPTQNDTDNDAEDQAERDPAEQEAESIIETLKDKPEVCHVLYTMLEEKYGNSDEKEISPDDTVNELLGSDKSGDEKEAAGY